MTLINDDDDDDDDDNDDDDDDDDNNNNNNSDCVENIEKQSITCLLDASCQLEMIT